MIEVDPPVVTRSDVPAWTQALGARVLAAGVAVLLAWAASSWSDGSGKLGRWVSILPWLSLGTMLVTLVPPRWVRPTQLVMLGVLFWRTRVRAATGLDDVWQITVLPVLLAGLALVVPWERRSVRLVTIGLATGAFGWLWVAELPNEGVLCDMLLELLFPAGTWDLARPTRLQAAAYPLVASAIILTPIPPADTWTVRRDAQHVLVGGLWVLVAAFLVGELSPYAALPHTNPLELVDDGRWAAAIPGVFLYWAIVYGMLAGHLLLIAGSLRLLALDIRSPVRSPWLSTSFLEFWRRSNVYRFRIFVEVYWRNLGLKGPWGVFCIFLISGLHHAALSVDQALVMVRWAFDGAASALTAWWQARAARLKVKQWLAGIRPPAPPRWRVATTRVASIAVVLGVHGLLLAIVRAPDLVYQWLGLP